MNTKHGTSLAYHALFVLVFNDSPEMLYSQALSYEHCISVLVCNKLIISSSSFRCLTNNIHSKKKNIKGLWKALLCAGISGLKMNVSKVFE
jgi:hypothetical protein